MKSLINWTTNKLKSIKIQRTKNLLLEAYEKKQFNLIPNILNTQQLYLKATFDSFPFLYLMISEGQTDAVREFVSKINYLQYLYLDQDNPLKINPLIYSYFQDKNQISQVLLNQGFNINFNNSDNQNILHLAAIYRRKNAFFAGIKRGASIQLSDIYGNTPLHYSCRIGQVQMIQALLAGNSPKKINKQFQFPIHMAIQSGNINAVNLLKNDLDLQYNQLHPIHSAARIGSIQVLKMLISKNIGLINLTDTSNMTPLHYAAASENTEAISFLLNQKGVNVNAVDNLGNIPLHISFLRDHLEGIQLLIQAKSNLDLRNNDYLTPVELGMDSTSPKIKSYLKSISQKSKTLRDWNVKQKLNR